MVIAGVLRGSESTHETATKGGVVFNAGFRAYRKETDAYTSAPPSPTPRHTRSETKIGSCYLLSQQDVGGQYPTHGSPICRRFFKALRRIMKVS